MNKKRLLSMLAALVLVAVIGVGATLAYFTDKEEKANIVTMGHVDITLTEPIWDDNTEDSTIKDVQPGQKITKDPTITVDEASEIAYIRATVTLDVPEGTELTEKQEKALDALIAGIQLEDGWYYNAQDQYYYYNTAVDPGTGVVLFKEIEIPYDWDNEFADLTFKIIVGAEAIQADFFEPAKDGQGNIIGWFAPDGTTPVTIENYESSISGN